MISAIIPRTKTVMVFHIEYYCLDQKYSRRSRIAIGAFTGINIWGTRRTERSRYIRMKLLSVVSILVGAVASVLGQTIELGYPTDGTVLSPGQSFTAQIIQPGSIASCIQVGIALAMDTCNNGVCPQPANQLGDVFYAGPWNPTAHGQGGFYQNFSLQVPQGWASGLSIFTLTHLCLLGGGPYPFLEFRNATLTIK
ncbi:hypothetical protein V8E55_001440 [Tylopilus felleus]